MYLDEGYFSSKARFTIHELGQLLDSGIGAYSNSIESISQYCDIIAEDRLQTYLLLLNKPSNENAVQQHRSILKVLEVGIQNTTAAQIQLKQASQSFIGASGTIAQLNDALNPTSHNFIRDLAMINMLKINVNEMKEYVGALNEQIETVDRKIIDMKENLSNDIQYQVMDSADIISDAIDIISDNTDIGELDDAIRNVIKISMEKLIADCRKFQDENNGKMDTLYSH